MRKLHLLWGILFIFFLWQLSLASDLFHLIQVKYIYRVDQDPEVKWYLSTETEVDVIRRVAIHNARIELNEFSTKDKFQVEVVVPFEKSYYYRVNGDDKRLKVWVDLQRKGYAHIKVVQEEKEHE